TGVILHECDNGVLHGCISWRGLLSDGRQFGRANQHFADALALRDHREDVRLALDTEVDHDRAVMVPCFPDRVLHLFGGLDADTGEAVCLGEKREVGPGERSAAVAAALEELLPLPNHTEVA